MPPRYILRRSVSPVPSYAGTYALPRFTRATSPVVIATFDDETRAIRARTKELLRRVNQPLPRSYYPDYQPPRMEQPEPLSHEAYIEQRVFTPMRHVHQDISTMSHYSEPGKQYIGRGHLACISFAGGRPIARRRALPRSEEDRNVREDVKFLSYYNRARAAALGPQATLEAMKGGSGATSSRAASAASSQAVPSTSGTRADSEQSAPAAETEH